MLVAVVVGCGASDPTTTVEYGQLQEELAALSADRDEVASERDELSATAGDAKRRVGELEAALEAAESEVAALRADLEAVAAENDRLQLTYDDEIRADLQAAYDAAVTAACGDAAAAPARPVEAFLSFDADWGHLGATEEDMLAAVEACAAPLRAEAQLDRAEAGRALAGAVALTVAELKRENDPKALEQALRDLASDVMERAIFEDPDADWVAALRRFAAGDHCGPWGCSEVGILEDLMLLGTPGAPTAIMRGGSRTVGSGEEEAAPGTWIAYDVAGCYWERLDDRGEVIDNNFVSAAPQVKVTIRASDYAFNSEDCSPWLKF